MAYKSLLAVIGDQTSARPLLANAAALAETWNAHLDVFAFGLHPLASAYAYGDVVVRAEFDMAATLTEAKDLKGFAESELRRTGAAFAVEALATFPESLSAEIGARARFSDLVLVPLPAEAPQPRIVRQVLEAALFEAHVPVLVLPPATEAEALTRRVVVGWNDRDAALSAVREAMPLLSAAERVEIVLVDPPAATAEGFDPGSRLAEYLAHHGARVEIVELAKTLPRVAEVFGRRVRDTEATLMVMGAYSHSRLREAVIGGTTRELLESATVPLFLSR